MATNFPSSLDSLTNPTATSTLSSPSHSAQHADANDAIEALEAKVGVNNSAVTTSLDYRVRNPELVGGGARPLLTGGAYIDGTNGLVLSRLTGNGAVTPDSAALTITGDMEVTFRASMTDWTISGVSTRLLQKATSAYQINIFNGTLYFSVRVGGVFYSNTAQAGLASSGSFVDGSTYWVRFTRVASTGACTVEWAADSATEPTVWNNVSVSGTQQAGNIEALAGPLYVGATSTYTDPWDGTIRRVIIRDGIGGTVVFDADFSAEAADTLAFTEDSSNAATVSVTTTRYTIGIPGQQFTVGNTSGSVTANRDKFFPFIVTDSIDVDMMVMEVTTGPSSASTVYLAIYNADDNYQPTGAPVVTTDFAVATSATGTFYAQFTPTTLPPGAYVIAYNSSVAVAVREYRSPIGYLGHALGTNSGSVLDLAQGRTAATFPNPSAGWNARFLSSVGFAYFVFLRWKAA